MLSSKIIQPVPLFWTKWREMKIHQCLKPSPRQLCLLAYHGDGLLLLFQRVKHRTRTHMQRLTIVWSLYLASIAETKSSEDIPFTQCSSTDLSLTPLTTHSERVLQGTANIMLGTTYKDFGTKAQERRKHVENLQWAVENDNKGACSNPLPEDVPMYKLLASPNLSEAVRDMVGEDAGRTYASQA